jgi:hypothetical protein
MSLSRAIAAALESPAGPGPVVVQEGPHRLELQVQEGSPVGVAFTDLVFSSGLPDRSSEQLKAWGDRLAARVTYLMEPLVVIEVDSVGGEVELRSQAPTVRHGRRTFFEVRLRRDGSLHLARVAFDEETRRCRPALCQMTLEVLERLADDLVAVAG